jgi:hypothetical protein
VYYSLSHAEEKCIPKEDARNWEAEHSATPIIKRKCK